MNKSILTAVQSLNWPRWIARIIILCWAGFWLFFFGANLIDALSGPIQWDGVAVTTFFSMLVIIPMVLAWRREKIGGIVLVVEALLIAIVYLALPPSHLLLAARLSTVAMLSLPPLTAGAYS